MIEVEEVCKSYGEVRAVQSVSFRAPAGRITGLLGPNGAGKTTTLRMLTGLIAPDSGRIRVDGIDVIRDAELARSRLAVLPDSHGLYPRLTARENIRYFADLHGLSKERAEAQIDRLLHDLDASSLGPRRCGGFSQGERMKINLARVLVHEPPCLILDEPSNGLDVMSTRLLRAMLDNQRAAGKCVILSSHIMQEVAALCDTIVIVAQGRVVAHGTKEEILTTAKCRDLEDAFMALVGLASPNVATNIPPTQAGATDHA